MLQPLEFSDCLYDSPFFRANLQAHEKELENTSEAIKGLQKECKRLLNASRELSKAQRSFAATLGQFKFEFIGSQTEKESSIVSAFQEFAQIVESIEDQRDVMIDSAQARLLTPLEKFRKEGIQGTREYKKVFDKQSEKYLATMDKCLGLSAKKKESALIEADALLDQDQRAFRKAAMDYVKVLLDVQERKKFEFVEPLLGFMQDQKTFYHHGYETFQQSSSFLSQLQINILNLREVWIKSKEYAENLMERALSGDLKGGAFARQGYLFVQKERRLGGLTSSLTSVKYFCQYLKESNLFVMMPVTDHSKGKFGNVESLPLDRCVRRMTDSIEKRFCFDVFSGDKMYVMQALSNDDRRLWLQTLDGREPVYEDPSKAKERDRQSGLTQHSFLFVQRCFETIEKRGIDEVGLYRVAGVGSRVTKLLLALEKGKLDKVGWEDVELEVKTITSAVKNHFRSMPDPLMTFQLHQDFTDAAKECSHETIVQRLKEIVFRLPQANYKMLKMLMEHLAKVADNSDENRMLPSNLGVVFGPTLMRPAEESVAGIMDIKHQNEIVELLIINFSQIFTGSPPPSGSRKRIPVGVEPSSLVSTPSSSTQSIPMPIFNSGAATPQPQMSPSTSPPPPDSLAPPSYQSKRLSGGPPVAVRPAPRVPLRAQAQRHNYRDAAMYGSVDLSEPHPGKSGDAESLNQHSGIEKEPPPFRAPAPPQRRLERMSTGTAPTAAKRSHMNQFEPSYMDPASALPLAAKRPDRSERRAKALYDCSADNPNELSFLAGEIVFNVRPSREPGWYQGTAADGRSGLIPENYIEMLP